MYPNSKTMNSTDLKPYEASITNNDGATIPVYRNASYGASHNNEERREMVRVGYESPSHVAVDVFNGTASAYPTPETTEAQVLGAIKYLASLNPERIYVVLPREGSGVINKTGTVTNPGRIRYKPQSLGPQSEVKWQQQRRF